MKIIIIVIFATFCILAGITVVNEYSNDQEFKHLTQKIITPISTTEIVTEQNLNDLPGPVKKYLTVAGIIGKNKINYAHILHTGSFRTETDGKWMNLNGEYFFGAEKIFFLWSARIKTIPFLYIAVRDSYYENQGRMYVKINSTYTIADSSGPYIDQSALGRYLGEMVFVPTAFLNSTHLKWNTIDDQNAEAIITDGPNKASCIFHFNDDGLPDIVKIVRYRDINGKQEKANFVGHCGEYKNFSGYLAPSRLEGTWSLPEGDFTYVKLEIKEITYF